ncbi:MAG: YidC/Oxa1 family membrane protein insertase [bacterium]|nr:YidC/Oxa1 family membrane protein insertase [bacterium]
MSELFNKILYQPLFDILVFLYQYLGDLGVAIIVLTVLIRIVLFPLFYKGAKDQAIMQRLAPKVKEIQTNHKNNREEQAKALMGLYREHRVNPLSGFLLILVQLPILIALYQVFMKGLSVEAGFLELTFLGLIDLSKRSAVIVGLAAVAQYFQGKLSIIKSGKPFKDLTPIERMGHQMVYLGPILTVIFLYFFNLPSAVGLYWLTTSLFSVIQQIIINKRLKLNGPTSS